MYLAARYLKTCSGRAEALELISLLDGVVVDSLDDVDQSSDFVFLDAEINLGEIIQRMYIILLTTQAGVDIYGASGLHLSATAEGAQSAFANGCIEQIIDEDNDKPLVCCIFKLTYEGSAHVFH